MMVSDETVISADPRGQRYLQDLWRYRELFLFLAWRDLLVRYKQTIVGVAWSLIRPLLTMVVLTVVFGRLGKMPSGGVPYPLMVFCGLLPWQFFATAVTASGESLVSNAGLISKVFFPRLLIPAASLATSLVDFLVSFAFLVALMIWYSQVPSPAVVLLPLFMVLVLAASFGAGLWTSALLVRYRDVRFILPFVVQFGLYISPVGFSSNVVPEKYRLVFALNPVVGVIDGFRWSILGGENRLEPASIVISTTVSLVLLATGIWYFRSTERTFADVI